MELKREITNTHLLFISFAAIFGSGWLFAPLYAAQIAGPASLIAWVLGALMSAVIGITMAEVVVLFPKTGGLNQISKITHGEFLALIMTVFNLLVFVILPSIEVRAVLQYASSYYSFLAGPENSISPLGYVFALVLLAFVTLVNLYGAKITSGLTQAVVMFKLVTPALICFTFLYVIYSNGNIDHSRIIHSTSPVSWSAVFQAIAVSGIIFSFNGFNQATLFAGEAKNPQKAIPFAILGSLLMSGLLYFVIQYVFLMAVPKQSIVDGWSKLAFAGDQGPFAGIAVLLGLSWILIVIYADAVISPLGTAFSYASAAPRLIYSLVEGKTRFFELNQHGVSVFAVFLTLALECIAFVFLPNLKAMIALLVAAFVLCYTTAPASLLMLRKTQPNLHRPFRVQMAPLVSFLSLLFSNLMVFSCGWVALRNLMVASGVFIGVYLIYLNSKNKQVSLMSKLSGSEWFLFQLCSIAGLSYYDQSHKLEFRFALLGVGVISLAVLIWSQKINAKWCAQPR